MNDTQVFRAPAVPLITHDPMFSVWSFATNLNDDTTRHWTGRRQFLLGALSVDGKVYEFLGKVYPDDSCYATGYEKMPQISCEIRPMSTVYTFETEKVRLTLRFTSALLLNDLALLSRPASYISWQVTALDGKEHQLHVYFGFSAELCVDNPTQEVSYFSDELSVGFTSGTERMLKRSGDDRRIEWGSFHVAAPGMETAVLPLKQLHRHIKRDNRCWLYPVNYVSYFGPNLEDCGPEVLEKDQKYVVGEFFPTVFCRQSYSLGNAPIENVITVAYDDVKSIQYFGENVEAYWRRDGLSFAQMLRQAISEYPEILQKVEKAENELLLRAGKLSPKYAQILALAYRQAIAGHKLTYHDGELQFFSKECFSNGCIATVDVTYPSIPLFLIYNPVLIEGMLNPVFRMVEKGLWKFEFAPHDVGTYPLANGQVYGYLERHRRESGDPINKQMPIEECGNMILCVAALCRAEGSLAYFSKHRQMLCGWADYLVKTGYNPENQLCTDDFAGHLAHNCNLSVKAICALGAMAQMMQQSGDAQAAEHYRKTAVEFAALWEKNAFDSDHYRLAFDREGSWSLKYNMVWDKLLGLGLFGEEVYQRELAYYKTKLNPYGIPLDDRADYTKSDWQLWTTAMFDDTEYFHAIIDRMWSWLCETNDRLPFSDYYFTSLPIERGFQARTVQGGLFIKLLKL